jgi:predicted GNAT family N-acyltransferase
VGLDRPDDAVVAYYALAAHKVARDRVPAAIGRGGPVEIPAVLLARLAWSTALRGQGLGPVLVADALGRVRDATRTVAARLVVVDALHESVARFYEHRGFRRIPDSLLLVQKISDIEAALRPPA